MSRIIFPIFLVFGLIAAACSEVSLPDERAAEPIPETTAIAAVADPLPDAPTPSTADAVVESAGLADWTFMVYVMGDNDLEPFALLDLLEMASVGSTDEVNIITLVDRHPNYINEDVEFIEDFEDTRAFLVGSGELQQGDPGDELNVGDPETLATFIEEGISAFPAEHYAVVLWNHGSGWGGMGPDETDGNDILDLAEIDQAFTDGLARAGVDNVDLIGFDACLMATYEVATTMADHADFMLASEELEPGHGWNYTALQHLVDNPTATPAELGAAVIDGFVAQAEAEQTSAEITLSLLDLTKMDQVESALADLAEPLMADPTSAAPLLAHAQTSSLRFGTNPDASLESNLVDLGQLTMHLGAADPALLDPATALRSALGDLVVTKSNGPATEDATGLSIYFPTFEENFRQGYLFLNDIPVWQDLLTSYYTAGQALPENEQAAFEAQTSAAGEAEYFFDEDGLNIFGMFNLDSQEALVEATVFYGVLDEGDGSIIFIGEEPGEVLTDGSGIAGAIYDLTVLTISDGIDTDYAYLDLTFDDSGILLIDVPLWYVPPEEFETDDPYHDVVLSLAIDPNGDVLSEVYYEIGQDGTFGELTADPDGLIYPIVYNEYPDGSGEWITLSEVGLYADLPNLAYDLEPLEAGTGLYAELSIFDYGGNTDTVAMFDTIPG